MRITQSILMIATALAFVGCSSNRNASVVQETYIHKYGTPMPKEDWSRNGKDGQVVQLRSDGVTVTRSFQQGVLHGKSSYTFPNSSTLARIEIYNRGELVSKTENYPSGVAKEEERFHSAVITERLCWYDDGTPLLAEKYDGGFISGGEYRTPMNAVESKVVDGKGVRLMRGNEGELVFKDTIEGGQMVERVTYFPSGDPSSVTPYKNGLVHGTRLTFLPGGLPNTVEEWSNGQQEGTTIVYQNGEKIAEVPYIKGKREGIEYRYRDGILLVEEVAWKNDLQHGPRKIIIDEDHSKTEWFHEGELVSRNTFERMNIK
jgi:antitoxin component YwqK of YwqJK toxin-antitoxin module